MGTTNKNKKTQDLITKKVMAVIFVFLVCNITCQSVIFGATHFKMCGRTIAVSLFDLAAVVNGTVNVMIYGCFDKKFRRIFKKMICPCIKPEPPSFDSSTRESTKKITLVMKESLINNPSIKRTPTVEKAKNAFLAMKWPFIGQPNNHIGWVPAMPFAWRSEKVWSKMIHYSQIHQITFQQFNNF